jgi:hypothetical protein
MSKAANYNAWWVNICQQRYKGQKVSEPTLLAVIDWVVKHKNVINLAFKKKKILIKAPGCNQKTPVAKLLLNIPVGELHNEMVSDMIDGRLSNAHNSNGKVPVSDTTALQQIIEQGIPQLHWASSLHKQMSGCVTCITAPMLQNALNGFWGRQLWILCDEYYDMPAGDDQDDAERLHEQYTLSVFPEDKHRHKKPNQALDDMMCIPV